MSAPIAAAARLRSIIDGTGDLRFWRRAVERNTYQQQADAAVDGSP